MYVRVKRAKTTMFLHVEPTETVMELKQKIQTATDSDETPGGIPIDRQRLLTGPTWEISLEDARQLQELKVENDAVLALVYATEDGGGSRSPSSDREGGRGTTRGVVKSRTRRDAS